MRLLTDKPVANVSSDEVLGWAGQVRELTCSASGLPAPSVSWEKGGHNLVNSSRFRKTSSWSGGVVTSVLQVCPGYRMQDPMYLALI